MPVQSKHEQQEQSRSHGSRPPDRVLIAAYEAALAVATELDAEAVLQGLVDLAREVVPAKYAALGVADDKGRIVQFVTSGISQEVRESLGPLPQGHGLLGVLIRDRETLIVDEIAADPRSVGFPPNHPPMKTLLGTPIMLGDRVLGDLYLTERIGGYFSEEDWTAIQVLAAHAATAIERAQLHTRLIESQRRAVEQWDQLRTIVDQLPSGILIQTAADGTIEHANTVGLDLLSRNRSSSGESDLTGISYEILQADGTPVPEDQWPGNRALRGEVVLNRRLILVRDDGQQIPVLTQATPIRDSSGDIIRAVVVYQDITRLREAEQLKDDFLSLISHEFRTPLTTIQGGASLLTTQGDRLDEATRHELLVDIATESSRLDRMLGNMLSVAAIMAGRLEAATEPVLVAPLVRRVAAAAATHAPKHAFTFDLPATLPPMEGDPELLAQVLRNLYENAIKYSPEAGEISTSATSRNRWVTICVTDQGVGIAPEHLPHLFQRFRRPGADPTIRGMGLGLYLSRLLVEAQSGSISASSPGIGLGTTIAIELPVAESFEAAGKPLDAVHGDGEVR
jgi:PAS domain S-box-containing protein